MLTPDVIRGIEIKATRPFGKGKGDIVLGHTPFILVPFVVQGWQVLVGTGIPFAGRQSRICLGL